MSKQKFCTKWGFLGSASFENLSKTNHGNVNMGIQLVQEIHQIFVRMVFRVDEFNRYPNLCHHATVTKMPMTKLCCLVIVWRVIIKLGIPWAAPRAF